MRVLILGCGYVGAALAADMVAAGHEVTAIRRTATGSPGVGATDAGQGLSWQQADVADPGFSLPAGPWDAVVHLAGPGVAEPTESLAAAACRGLARVLEHLAAAPPKRFVLASCSEVYGQTDGSLVKENSPADPRSPWGRCCRERENLLLNSTGRGFPGLIVRLGEVYGPGRLERMERFIRNEIRIPGRGQRYLNLIHRVDAAGSLVAALRSGKPGEIYNAVDEEPVTETHFYTWLSETLGKWIPPFGPEAPDAAFLPHRRISNRRLTMELGCRLKYPNFRHGFTAEIKRLTDAGQLEIQPEQR